MTETQKSRADEPMALSGDTPAQSSSSAADASTANTLSPGRWQLWTGVLGAVLAVGALLALVLLGQRLQQLQAEVSGVSQGMALASAQQQTLDELSAQLSGLNARLDAVSVDQRQQVTQGQARLDAVQTQLDSLARQKAPGWQLTDAPAVALMLGELQGLSALGSEPARLKAFVQQWQAVLAQAGVASDHALLQALASDLAALRLDAPVWGNSADAWSALHAQVLAVQTEAPVSQPAGEPAEGVWWEKWLKLVRITPASGEDASLSQQLRQRSLWPVQAALALEGVRAGLVLSQPAVVQDSAVRLQQLLAQQAPALASQWADTLDAWTRWQRPPVPEWGHLQRYLKAQQESQP